MKRKRNETRQSSPGIESGRSQRYQIQVQGTLDDSWSEWFGGLDIKTQPAEEGPTISWLTGNFADQAALRGVLNKLWDLNLTLLSIETGPNTAEDEPVAEQVERENHDPTF